MDVAYEIMGDIMRQTVISVRGPKLRQAMMTMMSLNLNLTKKSMKINENHNAKLGTTMSMAQMASEVVLIRRGS